MARFNLRSLSKLYQGQEEISFDQRCNIVFSQSIVFFIVFGLINLVQDALTDTMGVWLTDIVLVSVMAIFYWLNEKGFHTSSKICCIVILNVIIFYFSAATHNRSEVSVVFLAIMPSTLLFFGRSQLWISLLLSLVSFSMIVYLEAYEYQISWIPTIGNPAKDFWAIVVNIFSAFVGALLFTYVLVKINAESDKILTEKRNRLIRVNEELDKFVYRVSHDLKAPLASLKGLMNVAKLEPNPNLQHYLPMMEDRVGKLEDFIQDIIDYTQNNRSAIKKEGIDLKKLVVSQWEELMFSEGMPPVNLKIDIVDNFLVFSDKRRLSIVLNNLISNAIKYHDASKPRDQRFVQVKATAADDTIAITIRDNGIGIAEASQPRLFEMFYRATNQAKGSGLGLFIVKETVEKLNGKIQFKSVVNVVTEFEIMLPKD